MTLVNMGFFQVKKEPGSGSLSSISTCVVLTSISICIVLWASIPEFSVGETSSSSIGALVYFLSEKKSDKDKPDVC